MKSKKIKDERVLQLNNKIQSEAYSIVLFIAFVSMFTKSFVLDMSFTKYAIEFSIVVISLAYVVIRSMFLGHNLVNTSKVSKRLTIFTIFISSLIITTINGIRNYVLYGNKYIGIFDRYFIAVIVITFISAFIFSFILFSLLYWFNERGQRIIEKKLKEDDD